MVSLLDILKVLANPPKPTREHKQPTQPKPKMEPGWRKDLHDAGKIARQILQEKERRVKPIQPQACDLNSFKEFIGNAIAKERLQIMAEASRVKNTILPHIAIIGSAGCGKTTLSALTARMVGASFFYVNGTSINSPNQFRELVLSTQDYQKSIVMIDEAHGLPREIQDNMLSLLEKPAVLCTPQRGAAPVVEPLVRPITFIFATTHAGNLTEALRSRFEIIKLEDYTREDYKRMARQIFQKRSINVDEKIIEMVAKRCRSARDLKHQIERIIDTSIAYRTEITEDVVKKTYRLLGVDALGMVSDDRKVVLALDRGPISASGIASILHISTRELQRNIEPHLLRLGLIRITSSGRELTDTGKLVARKLKGV